MELKIQDLMQAVELDTEYNKRCVKRIINSFLKLFILALIRGMSIKIPGFGTFRIQDSDKKSPLYYKREVVFESSRYFREKLNRN